jgi:hypothetical protein
MSRLSTTTFKAQLIKNPFNTPFGGTKIFNVFAQAVLLGSTCRYSNRLSGVKPYNPITFNNSIDMFIKL